MNRSLRKIFEEAPRRATVVDVSARDGLQAEPVVLTPERRAAWVRAVLSAGVPEVEAASFVSPSRVPQMAGAARVLAELADVADRLWVLVPNRTGAEQALEAGARNLVCVVSATETHSEENLGRSTAQVLSDLEKMVPLLREARVRSRAAVSMAWVDPVEGIVPRRQVLDLCSRLTAMGFEELTLCDTHGGASPRGVSELIEELKAVAPPEALGLHLHDTFGAAGANALMGLLLGVTRLDASLAGLGGCPFAPGARGNIATEQLVHLLHSLSVGTGISEEALREVRDECLRQLGDDRARRLPRRGPPGLL
ncbi:MAG: hydroxymethylglutaryl-CoA lyase [Deltaproteobacteria bacterium]|nr:hydroxymethylglutaryl-CoA lyase [Deltaproteobacteria bacterium]